MKIKIDGLDDALKDLKRMEKNAKKFNNTETTVPLNELVNDKFVQKNSKFKSLDEMVEKSGYDLEEFGESKEVDRFISQNSRFSSWEELHSEAIGEWGMNQILK